MVQVQGLVWTDLSYLSPRGYLVMDVLGRRLGGQSFLMQLLRISGPRVC
jgi:hypothetical protein